MARFLLLVLSPAVCLEALEVHFLAPTGYWQEKVPKLDTHFQEWGLTYQWYNAGDVTSEAAGAQEVLDRVQNSTDSRHVLLVVPTEPVRSGDYSMYQALIDSGTFVIWFGTYLKDGALGPAGTMVACPDDYSGGQFVALRFCTLAAMDPSPKKVALVKIPGATYRLRGFQDGVASYCGSAGHDLTVVEPALNSSATDVVDSVQVPTTAFMKRFLTANPSVNAVFSPSQYVTSAVISAAQAVRSSSANPDGLQGMLLSSWHNVLQTYLRQSKIYADIDRSRSGHLSEGVAKFLKYEDLDAAPPQTLLTPVKKRVPTMDGFVKAKLLSVYDKNARPPADSEALPVRLGARVAELQDVDGLSKKITMKLDLTLNWRDPRLVFDVDEYDGILRFEESEVWYPKVDVSNQLENADKMWRSITADSWGRMTMHESMAVTLNCPTFDLADFPADRQECPIAVKALGRRGQVELAGASQTALPKNGSGFTIEAIGVRDFGSATLFTMDMVRNSQKYLLTHQLPGVLFVFMGFSSFWIPNKAVPARVTLAIVMVLVTLSLWQTLPRAGTMMDRWFVHNLFFQALTFFITVLSTNSHFNVFLRHLLATACRAKRKKDEVAKAWDDPEDAGAVGGKEPPRKPRLLHMLCFCACGIDDDMLADSLARRFVPIAYCLTTAVFFFLMR